MIRLTNAPETLDLNLPVGALCVHHKASMPVPGCESMTFAAFAEKPQTALKGRNAVVVVGMSRARTPSNRAQPYWDALYHFDGPRYSVDRTLFVGEPWRALWHFNLVGAPYQVYTYSYLAETHWRAYREGLRADDPFSADALIDAGRGVITSDKARFFDLTVETVPVGESAHAGYQAEKTAAFAEEHTFAAIMRRLSVFAANACPARSMPTTTRVFDDPAQRVVQTDLGIDEYLVDEIVSVADITNRVAEAFA